MTRRITHKIVAATTPPDLFADNSDLGRKLRAPMYSKSEDPLTMIFASRLKTLTQLVCAALIVVMLFVAACQLCLAQTGSAALSGTITDKSGALVAGASVEVMSQDTGTSVHTRTNGAGVYSVPGLKPGLYKVSVEKEGFKRVAVRDITLNVQDVVSRNFMLDVGAMSETVEVTGDSLNINT